MTELKLPIDVVPGTVPPRFIWYYYPTAMMPVKCEGIMIVSIESAMLEMISICKNQHKEIAALKDQLAARERQEIVAMEKGLEEMGLMPDQVRDKHSRRKR